MFKSTKIVVTLMAALAVLIGTVSATYYFLGVSPLNTAGIAQLNDNIARIKHLLTSSQADNTQLTSALNTAQATLSQDNNTMTKLAHDNSVLAAAITDRYQVIMATATALNIPDLSQYYVTPPNDNPFTDQNGQVLDSDKLSPVILNAITALKTASATSQDWQNKYTDLQSAIRAAYLDAGGDPTQQPTLATLMQQLKAQTIAQFTAQNNFIATPYNSIQNPGHYQFITPPNAKDVDATTLSQNYYRYDYTVNTTNANNTPIALHKSIEIPNTLLFQHLIP